MSEIIWPKTVIFWGAGATAALGFPTTYTQGKMLISLSEANSVSEYREKLGSLSIFTGEYLDELADLLYVLDDDTRVTEREYSRKITNITDSQYKKAEKLFNLKDKKLMTNHIVNLRYDYDVSALKQIVMLCNKDPGSIVMNVFSLIDYHMGNNEGFFSKDGSKCFMENHRLQGARNALIMFIVSIMTGAYLNTLDSKEDITYKYKKFATDLALYMEEEGTARKELPYTDRAFYMFSYAVISLNWDHFFNWMIFHAHKDFNDDKSNDCFAGRHIKLKFFNDFGILMGLRELKKNDAEELSTKIWYPYNESVVQRINDPEYNYEKIVRIGKYYYPHGSLAWRCCPNCGSMTGNYGDLWKEASQSLFPPSLIPASRKIVNRSDKEKDWVRRGCFDAYECSYCGAKTELKDTPLLMQTPVKSNVPPALRMIRADINACLEHAEHLVFMGYSLPDDDMVWRSILLARKGKVKVSAVVGTGGPGRWQKAKKARQIKGGFDAEQERFLGLFGNDGIRFYTGGIPNVFDEIDIADLLIYS
jgi:hypothetical protein